MVAIALDLEIGRWKRRCDVIVKILGSGCSNCARLEQNAREVAEKLGVEATFEKVMDVADIMSHGVMTTPALVVDEQVKVAGRVRRSMRSWNC